MKLLKSSYCILWYRIICNMTMNLTEYYLLDKIRGLQTIESFYHYELRTLFDPLFFLAYPIQYMHEVCGKSAFLQILGYYLENLVFSYIVLDRIQH